MKKDIEMEAKNIITMHTKGMMSATIHEFDTNEDLWETMISECSFILTDKFLNGDYTPMEYNGIRNAIAEILNSIFEPLCSK